MPLLAAFVGALVAGLAEFLAGFVTRKVAIYAALSAVMLASWAAMAAAIWSVTAGVAASMPQLVVDAFAFLFPANLGTVIAGAVAIEGTVTGFRLHMGNVRAAAAGH
jgi:hypothetical protein